LEYKKAPLDKGGKHHNFILTSSIEVITFIMLLHQIQNKKAVVVTNPDFSQNNQTLDHSTFCI